MQFKRIELEPTNNETQFWANMELKVILNSQNTFSIKNLKKFLCKEWNSSSNHQFLPQIHNHLPISYEKSVQIHNRLQMSM